MYQKCQTSLPTVAVLLGATGSGKTRLISELDPNLYEIISCDSRQCYKELETGTAAPDLKLRKKIPHHLVGIFPPSERITAAQFSDLARKSIFRILKKNKRPVLVGGSGFYYSALQNGMFPVPDSPHIRKELEKMSHVQILALLQKEDPASLIQPERSNVPKPIHPQIHPNDKYRVFRAMEIILSCGRRWSEIWEEQKKNPPSKIFHFSGFCLSLSEDRYHQQLRERAEEMIHQGIIDEAGSVYEKYGDCPGLQSIGYRDAIEIYLGKKSIHGFGERLFQSHRFLGKKQRLRFRKEKSLLPVEPDSFFSHFHKMEKRAF